MLHYFNCKQCINKDTCCQLISGSWNCDEMKAIFSPPRPFYIFSRSENFGAVRYLHVFLLIFEKYSNDSVLCSSAISTSVGILP